MQHLTNSVIKEPSMFPNVKAVPTANCVAHGIVPISVIAFENQTQGGPSAQAIVFPLLYSNRCLREHLVLLHKTRALRGYSKVAYQ